MAMNYNKLWKLMIDRNLMKKDLIQMAGISTNAMAKMGKGGDVSTQVLRKICVALNCKIEDIVEITENKSVFQDTYFCMMIVGYYQKSFTGGFIYGKGCG